MSFLSVAFSAVATTIKSMFSDTHAPPLIQSSSPRVPSPIPSAVPPLSPSVASNHSRSPHGDNPFWTEHQPKRKHNDREDSVYSNASPARLNIGIHWFECNVNHSMLPCGRRYQKLLSLVWQVGRHIPSKSLAGVCLADTARQDAELVSNKTLHNCAKKSGYPMLKCDTCSTLGCQSCLSQTRCKICKKGKVKKI